MITNTFERFISRSVLGAALALTLAPGCIEDADLGDDIADDDDITPPNQPGPEETMLRVVHGSPDAPAVDVYVEGVSDPVFSGLNFGDTSDYATVPAGDYNVQLRASPSSASDPVVYETGSVELRGGSKLTSIAAGLAGSTADSNKLRVLLYEETFGPSGSDNAVVRVVHASPDAPSVGIDLHDDDPSAPEITGLDRFTASDAAGIPLSAGQNLQIGIAAGGQRVTAFTTPALPAGAQLFVIATGLTSELAREADGFSLLAVGPDGTVGFIRQNPIVYALHASPNAPAVEAFAGDAELIAGIQFGELSAALQLAPGDYSLDFYPQTPGSARPAGAPAASASTGMLSAGERYLTIATGLLGGSPNGFQLASYAEGFDLSDPDDVRLRLVHSSPDAPAVDVGILNVENVVNPVLVSNVSFPSASDASGLAAGLGTIPFGVTPTGANDTVVASFHVTTAPGLRAFGVAAGALDPQNGMPFRLLVVDTATTPWSVATIHPQP